MIRGASLSFSDPDQYQERIRPAEVEITPTAGGPFRATLSQLQLGALTVQHGWQSLPIVARCALDRTRNTIIFHSGTVKTSARVNGTDLVPEIFGLFGQGEEHFLHTSAEATWGTLTLTPQTYAAARAILIGDDFNPILRTRAVRPTAEGMNRLRALHQKIRTAFDTAPDQAVHPEVARGAEQSLLVALIDCLADGDEGKAGPPLGNRKSTTVIRRLFELLDASDGLPLYLLDVCARLGISRRTLHNACAEHVGLSPHRFLWLRRMHLARQALLRADPALTSVTEIATNAGFWELGRFAVSYRQLYGESPSATLVGAGSPFSRIRRAAHIA